jgi:hypothetical protein
MQSSKAHLIPLMLFEVTSGMFTKNVCEVISNRSSKALLTDAVCSQLNV